MTDEGSANEAIDRSDHGFNIFDAVCCTRHSGDAEGEERLRTRWRLMGVTGNISVIRAVATPADERIGRLATHRLLLGAAARDGLANILIFDDQVLWHEEAASLLADASSELRRVEWNVCVLDGLWPLPLPAVPGCRRLARAGYGSVLHAVAYHRRCFERALAEWPPGAADLAEWVEKQGGLDDWVAGLPRALALRPAVACAPELLPFQSPALQHRYTA